MKENLKEIKTTIIGSILFLVGIVITLIEYFTIETVELKHYLFPSLFTIIGLGFVLAPDRLLDFLFSWAKNKTNT